MTTIPDPFTVTAQADTQVDIAPSEGVEFDPAYSLDAVFSKVDRLYYGDITIALIDVTPEMAKAWRERYNTHNRPIVGTAVKGHVRDVEDGNWLFVGDAIRFAVAPDGTEYMADGQHRAKMIEDSGIAQTYIVVRGLDNDAQAVIDTNRVRTFAHTLSLEEGDEEGPYVDVNRLGAIVRRVFLFQKLGKLPRGGGSRTPTKQELRNFLSKHSKRFRAALAVTGAAASASPKLGKSATMIGAAYFILSGRDQEAADIFFKEMLIKGFGLDDEHPVTHLRRRYGREGVYAVSDDEAFMLTLLAWNKWRKNERLSRTLQTPTSGWPNDVREYPIF